MTLQTPAVAVEEPDEVLEPAESSWKSILGSTLTFITLVLLWELLVRELTDSGLAAARAERNRACLGRLAWRARPAFACYAL